MLRQVQLDADLVAQRGLVLVHRHELLGYVEVQLLVQADPVVGVQPLLLAARRHPHAVVEADDSSQLRRGGFFFKKIISVGTPTYTSLKTGLHANVSPRNWFSRRSVGRSRVGQNAD